MKSNLFSIMAFIGLVGGITLACNGDDAEGGCTPGTEMCECAGGTMCFSGLACTAGVCFPDSGGTTDPTDTDTSGGADPEGDACARADECNLLEAGVSTADCADEMRMCTGELLTSEYADWTKEVENCLEFANCKNFQGCITEISACQPIDGGNDTGGSCVEDGMPCDFCWFGGLCDPLYIGGDDGCDCDCANGPDPDCG